jgi:hypothetical protein
VQHNHDLIANAGTASLSVGFVYSRAAESDVMTGTASQCLYGLLL